MNSKKKSKSFILIGFFIILFLPMIFGNAFAEFGEGESSSEGLSNYDKKVEGTSGLLRLGNEVKNITELQAAINAASNGDVITLESDFLVEDITITVPLSSVIIDGKNVDFSLGSIRINNGQNGTINFVNFKFISPSNKQAFIITASSKIEIENTFIANRTTSGDGSGMGIGSNGNVYIKNTTFKNNISNGSGYTGGAIAAKSFNGVLNIENTTFIENKNMVLGTGVLGGEGGAIYISNMTQNAKFTIKNSYFEGNEAVKDPLNSGTGKPEFADGGAIAFFNVINGAQINIDGTTFYKNIAGDDGGAILLQTNDDIPSGITFTNNTFYKNVAQSAETSLYSGGAIQLYANGGRTSTKRTSYVTFENNTFAENEVTGSSTAGAIGGYGVGLFSDTNKVGANLKNNIFAGNTGNKSIYNNIRIKIGFLNDLGGNVGIDNGTLTTLTKEEVFGEYSYLIAANSSGMEAGCDTNKIIVPTLVIRPAGHADNIGGSSSLALDQRGIVRSNITSDSGAVEIGYVLFDANGGIFDQETHQASYNGDVYQEKNASGDIEKIYKVATLGNSVTEPGTSPSLVGKTLKGWSGTPDGVILTQVEIDGILSGVTEEKTLYAVYQLERTVSYDANGGVGTAPVDLNSPYIEDSQVTVLGSNGLTILGHTFTSWNTKQDGTGIIYLPFDTFNINEDTVLYAQWEVNKHTLTFIGNGGVPDNQTVEVIYDFLLPNPPVEILKEGYTFEGWYGEATLLSKVDFTSYKMPDNDITLYAKWRINSYNVTFVPNAGEGVVSNMPANQVIDFSSAIVEPTPAPERYGYDFLGWHSDKLETSPWNFATGTMPARDVVLYAQWYQTHFSVSFDINSGTESTKPKDLLIKAGDIADISVYSPDAVNEPKKDGHVFLGWKNENNDFSPNTFTMLRKDVILKAQWGNWADSIKIKSEKNIVVYKDEATAEKIKSHIGATAEITTSNGIIKTKEVFFEWDEGVLKTGGVYTIRPYILDDSGKKHYGKDTIDLYVLNKAYISAAEMVLFNIGDTPAMNGSSWGAKLIEEKVDFTTRKIVRLLSGVNQDISQIDNHVVGTYNVNLFATVTDHFGKRIDITKNVLAVYSPKYTLSEEEQSKSDSTYFWIEVSKGLHLSKKNELWYFDKLNYKDGGKLRGKIDTTSSYDRKIDVTPEPFYYMTSEVFEVLKEHKNSSVEVDLGLVKWYFNSNNYKGQKYEPTGFFNLRVKEAGNEKLSGLVSGKKNMPLLFEMDKDWQGVHTLEVKLNDSLKNSKNLYMFNFNDDTKELELIGKMDVSNGLASIKMKEVRKQYVIVEGISINEQSTKDTKNNLVNSYKDKSSMTFSYRITEKTNAMNDETKKEIENSLFALGKTINDISLITSNSDSNVKIAEEARSNSFRMIALSVILVILVLLLILFIIRYIRLKKCVDKKFRK